MNRTAHRIIWNYSRMNEFLGYAEMRQEAEVARLEALGTWREDGGANADTYANRAVALRLSLYTIKQRSPVSAGASGIARKLAGIVRVYFDTGRENHVMAKRDHREPVANRSALADRMVADASIERRLDMARASAAIRRLINSHPDGWLAKDVLLGERKPGEVAAEMGIRRRDVSRAVRTVKQALAQAPELQIYAGL